MKNEVLLCDCMEFMTGCKDNEFDLAIVDPPYGIKRFKRKEKNCYSRCQYGKDNKKNWNNIKPDKKYFNELFRISKNQIIWGANNFDLPTSEYFIIWNKKQYIKNFAECELAYTNIKIPAKIFNYLWAGKFKQKREKKINPAHKPIALYKWLLKNYAKPGQKIFDSHVGSGSSRIAAYDMNFEFIGCEIDKDYWAAQNERFNNHIAQLDLFPKEEIQEKIFNQGVI